MRTITCVTTHTFAVSNRRTKKTKKQNTLNSYFGVCQEENLNFFSEKWRQDVPWLETNDKRTEMCAHTGELRKVSRSRYSSEIFKLGEFHKNRCYVWGYVWGAYRTPTPTQQSDSIKKVMCTPVYMYICIQPIDNAFCNVLSITHTPTMHTHSSPTTSSP